MFGIHRGDLPQSPGHRLNSSRPPCRNSKGHIMQSTLCITSCPNAYGLSLKRANFFVKAPPLINLLQMATKDACACFQWTFRSALSYLFLSSGERFYVSEVSYCHCNCLLFSISTGGFYFPQ